jgi:hypothetical protein
MEATGSSEELVTSYKITQGHNLEVHYQQISLLYAAVGLLRIIGK